MLYSKGGIYHAIYHWYIAIYKVVYTLLFNTAPLLCYKLFNTARCYVTSYLTLLYNMLNQLPWMRPFCSAVFIHRQTRPWPHHHHHQHHPQAHHPPPQPPSQGRCCCPRWALRSEKHGEPGPELARHVLVEALVLFPVKVLVILGEARVQRFPRVCRLDRLLYTPRLQCWPQSSWRYTRSWEAQWSAWRPCWLGNPKRWTSRRCSRILGQSTSRFTSCLSWKRFVRKAKIASMKIACRYKPCLFLSRRTLHAISSLDRSTSETLKDKNIYLACFFNKSHLTEAHKGISLLYLNWNNWRWSTFQKETLD